jgi:chromosome segregation ATPase
MELEQIADSCQNTLVDLEEILHKYSELESSRGNLSKKVKRVWKRLSWEPDDIRELRDRIVSNITLLNAYLGRVSM